MIKIAEPTTIKVKVSRPEKLGQFQYIVTKTLTGNGMTITHTALGVIMLLHNTYRISYIYTV